MARPLLIVGGRGQVGGALIEAAGIDRCRVTRRTDPPPGTIPLDLLDLAADPSRAEAIVREAAPEVIVIAAGFTRVDGCEEDPARAFRVNRDAPRALARAASRTGARTVYYSTEYVFDGRAGPYAEDDATNPLSVYGASKLAGEEAVRAEDDAALVIRTTVVYGPEERGVNFAYQLAARLGAGEPMRVPADQVSSPTYNRDLARATLALLESGATGTWHVTGVEVLDRYAFALRLARALDLDGGLLEPVTTAELGQTAARPLRAGLRIDRLRASFGDLELHGVEAAVRHWLAHPRGKELRP